MTTNNDRKDRRPIEDPLADLELQLIGEYLKVTGHDLQTLLARGDASARKLLAEASAYASQRLSEIEARSHYVHKLHGAA